MELNKRVRKRRSKVKIKNRIKKYILMALSLIVFIFLVGVCYEKMGEYKDSKAYPSVGHMVEVNNHKINVFSKGEGNKTVVFLGGLNEPSAYADFYPLYSVISDYTKVAVYDKPGHGWSEVTEVPRDIDSIVKELHIALEKSAQKPPYILVGHSLASLTAIRFAQTYKNEVSGIVLIDSGSPEYYNNANMGVSSNKGLMYRTLKNTGIARFAIKHTSFGSKVEAAQNNLKFLPNELKQLYLSMSIKTMYNKNIVDESNLAKENSKKIMDSERLGDIPLRLFTSESNVLSIPGWEKSQLEFKSWSKDSKQMTVKGSRHSIHQFSPDLINEEIIKLIKN